MLAFRTMSCDGLKDDVNNATSFCKRSSITLCKFVVGTRTTETASTHFVSTFVRPSHFGVYKETLFAFV